jgi:hypothetical protein
LDEAAVNKGTRVLESASNWDLVAGLNKGMADRSMV